MEKNRSSKIIAVVALVVAVFGLTLGFAAFSNTLTISSSAYVSPSSENFKINFSTSETDSTVTGNLEGTITGGTGHSAGTATVTASKISDIKANLTTPGQGVSYEFYVHNTGEYDAYLNTITYANVSGASASKVCAAVDETITTASLVSAACESISITVKVGDDAAVSGSQATISGHKLEKGSKEKVVVSINYAENGNRADGEFNVAFGDITLTYGTVD